MTVVDGPRPQAGVQSSFFFWICLLHFGNARGHQVYEVNDQVVKL